MVGKALSQGLPGATERINMILSGCYAHLNIYGNRCMVLDGNDICIFSDMMQGLV